MYYRYSPATTSSKLVGILWWSHASLTENMRAGLKPYILQHNPDSLSNPGRCRVSRLPTPANDTQSARSPETSIPRPRARAFAEWPRGRPNDVCRARDSCRRQGLSRPPPVPKAIHIVPFCGDAGPQGNVCLSSVAPGPTCLCPGEATICQFSWQVNHPSARFADGVGRNAGEEPCECGLTVW